ncbi:MAG: hypothetical protein ACXWKN_08310 [Phenylobacterium sp.]
MRAATPLLAAALLMVSASGVLAAPTCRNAQADVVRCGAPGAMPPGWTPPASAEIGRKSGEPDAADDGKLLGLTVFLAGFFALIALMPDFEGKWDRQAGDDDRR